MTYRINIHWDVVIEMLGACRMRYNSAYWAHYRLSYQQMNIKIDVWWSRK